MGGARFYGWSSLGKLESHDVLFVPLHPATLSEGVPALPRARADRPQFDSRDRHVEWPTCSGFVDLLRVPILRRPAQVAPERGVHFGYG